MQSVSPLAFPGASLSILRPAEPGVWAVNLADEAFCCAICTRIINLRWNRRGRDEELPPVCIGCERQYTEGVGKPAHGSFRDRREVMRGFALAEALHTAAAHQQWSARWPNVTT